MPRFLAILSLIISVCACAEEPREIPQRDVGRAHNEFIEAWYASGPDNWTFERALDAARVAMPEADLTLEDVIDGYEYLRVKFFEAGLITPAEKVLVPNPAALTRELVSIGSLSSKDRAQFMLWLDDPARDYDFSQMTLARDVYAHSTELWTRHGKLEDGSDTVIGDTIGALIGYGLGGSVGGILLGGYVSLIISEAPWDDVDCVPNYVFGAWCE